MPANRLGIVIVSLLFAGCMSPRSIVDRTSDSAFDNARGASLNESLNPGADTKPNDVASSADGAQSESFAISAPSPSQNRPTIPIRESSLTETSAADELRLARADIESGRTEAGIARYQQLLKQEPRNVDAHHGLAVIADNSREYLVAEQHYKAALQERPTDAGLLSDLGYSYLLQGKLDDSVEVLSRATQLQPEHRQALNNLGLAYALKKDSEKSFAAFRRADGEEAARARIAQLFPDQNPGTIATAAAPESATNLQIVPRTTLAGAEVLNSSAELVNPIVNAVPEYASAPLSTEPAAQEPTLVAVAEETPIADWPSRPQARTTSPPTAQPSEIVIDTPLTDRQAALLGMNAGACGPFPMFYQPQVDVTVSGTTITTTYQPSVPEQIPAQIAQTSAPGMQNFGTAQSSQLPTNLPTSSTGTPLPADPLASFEAELRRRAAEDYSSQRSFRTGATRAVRPTAP